MKKDVLCHTASAGGLPLSCRCERAECLAVSPAGLFGPAKAVGSD